MTAPEGSLHGGTGPELELMNRQRVVVVDMDWMSAAARLGLVACWRVARARGGALAHMHEVGVTLVSDRKIAALHREFMGIPGPTDVITFQHGEIVVSVETAMRVARERGISMHGEIVLYVVHGFLHLSGMDDVSAELREQMHGAQEQICATIIQSMVREARDP